MSGELKYSSAAVSMLDRSDQSSKNYLLYPITRVELKELRGAEVITVRTFVVNDAGRWVEAS